MPRMANTPLHITPNVRDDIIKHLEVAERTLSDLEADDAATLPTELRTYIQALRKRDVSELTSLEDLRDEIADELEGLL